MKYANIIVLAFGLISPAIAADAPRKIDFTSPIIDFREKQFSKAILKIRLNMKVQT